MKTVVKSVFNILGLNISRIPNHDAPSLYIDLSLIQEAEKAGVYIGDYAEKKWGEVGKSKKIVEDLYLPNLKEDSVILESGAGTGRYVKKMLEHTPKGKAHLYELDPYWKNFLDKTFAQDERVAIYPTNGYSYDDIPDSSVDLYCANGVFVYTKSMVTYRNLLEAVRVTKPNGVIAFDFFNLDEQPEILDFIKTNTYPQPEVWSLDSLAFISEFMKAHGCELEKTYKVKCHNYHSTYALFRKTNSIR